MAHALPTYRPSGSFNALVLPLAVLALLPGALLALAYQWLVHVIPFVYLNLLVMLGFAAALGLLVSQVVHWARCRNRAVAVLLGIVVATTALAASYGWDYRSTIGRVAAAHPELTTAQIRAEYDFASHLGARQEAGWKVKSSTFRGTGVLLVWAVEALATLGLVVIMAWGSVGTPFCERCGRWTTKRELTIAGRSRDDLEPLLARGDLDATVDLQPPVEAAPWPALRLSGSLCPGCRECGFLSVSERNQVMEKGKSKEQVHELLAHAILSPEQRARFEARATASPS